MTLFDPDDVDDAPHPPVVRVRLTVAYDGTAFHGFAPNPGVRTVGGSLLEALERVLRHPIGLTCAGRTDKGVHAHGQVVDFVTTAGTDLPALARALNSLCGPAVAVREAEFVPEGFSARFDAVSRRYRYTIHNGPVPDPFSVHTAWHVPHPLDLDRLRLACDPFIGTHDFTSFCRRATRADGAEQSSVREVDAAHWEVVDAETLRFWVEASSFCHQMVRSIVGTIVDVGLGKRTAGDIRSVIAARDRNAAGTVAPPHGLTLWHVRYPTP
ncbi:MAG: tRNA pseudouridine(38-40) synthase TruA [Acidimicrobiales bacterium]